MEEKLLSRSQQRKRPFFEDEDLDSKPPAQKRVRFPKGKKVRTGEESASKVLTEDVEPADLNDPRVAAKERANRRNQITAELFSDDNNRGTLSNISVAEISYKDYENFVEDGIQIEPFNLSKEREEGYFDADGNFVEYVREKEIKDAWLDSVEVDPKFTGKVSIKTNNGEDDKNADQELSSEEIGLIKRRIANVLEPRETVLQALRRLKGSSNNRKEKMSAETQHLFNQLTEDAMKLMESGDYNVYEEKQEVFQREAEGYERVARAKGKTLFSDLTNSGSTTSAFSDSAIPTSNTNATAADISSNDNDAYDMFADDDEHDTAQPSADKTASDTNTKAVSQSSLDALNTVSETGALDNDYVYDESSGYYYSSSLGYYYDPSTGLYCSAASGIWYKFNEETSTYEEIHEVASNGS